MSFFLLTLHSYAQKIELKTIDHATKQSIPSITFEMKVYHTQDSLNYFVKTDENGTTVIDISVYLPCDSIQLHVNSHFYKCLPQTINPNTLKQQKTLLFVLSEKVKKLEEVNISAQKSPIKYGKDSITINTDYYKEETDEHLENTLSRVGDLSIDKNGEITVKNQKVQKILINGQEVSDYGSALITRSINPNDVDKIQIRLDEKNTAMKNSIVDDEKLVIIDISLKKNVDLGLFGKVGFETGKIENEIPIGGLVNLFSVPNKGYAIQVFSERNNFGEQAISLEQIKNIGQEAQNKMFSTPIQFDDLIGRETFNEDFYGLNNIFYRRENTIGGFAFKKKISKNSSLFIGSFSELKNNKDQFISEQYILQEGTVNSLTQKEQKELFTSINKIEYRFNQKKQKLKIDMNLEYDQGRNDHQYQQLYEQNQFDYNYLKEKNKIGLYGNLLYEKLFPKKIGLQVKIHQSFVKNELKISNKNNDTFFPDYLQDFTQNDLSENPFFVAQVAINKRFKKGSIKLGYLFFNKSNTTNLISSSEDFSGGNKGNFQKNTFFINFNKRWNGIKLKFEPGYSVVQYDDKTIPFFEYNSKINFRLPFNIDCDLVSKQQVSNFELTTLTNGKRLIAYNQILNPPNFDQYQPQLEYNFEAHLYRNFYKIGLIVSAASVYGLIYNSDNFFSENFPIIEVQKNQNSNSLLMSVLSFDKNFTNHPIQMSLELGNIRNGQLNKTIDDEEYHSDTNRYLSIFKISSTYKKRWYNFESTIHYNKTLFQNANDTDEMNSISIKGKINSYIVKRRLVISPTIQYLRQDGLQNLNFMNLHCKILYSLPKSTPIFILKSIIF
ncbi:hypothetical protein [Flammeovirga sp. OC4]|uniref:hypothetical protein n=1 Tax=Flammeovirga sp. OC4 TaxID=1382345 RepID=UPI0012E04869|nr:hypothetical protein [Flammeovirga sp. OC4]